MKLPISLCMFVKNEEANLLDSIESVRPIASEIIIVDTGSTDNTVKLARKITSRVYQVPFTDFGSIRTLTAHLASYPWVLMLDADERIDSSEWGMLSELISVPVGTQDSNGELDVNGNIIIDSYAFPRKRWSDPWMNKQVDKDSYPDWQVRLFYNHKYRDKITYLRRVHETINGCVKTHHCVEGPTIHHFQNGNKSKDDLIRRKLLYTKLYDLDVEEGIKHTEPAVLDVDNIV